MKKILPQFLVLFAFVLLISVGTLTVLHFGPGFIERHPVYGLLVFSAAFTIFGILHDSWGEQQITEEQDKTAEAPPLDNSAWLRK